LDVLGVVVLGDIDVVGGSGGEEDRLLLGACTGELVVVLVVVLVKRLVMVDFHPPAVACDVDDDDGVREGAGGGAGVSTGCSGVGVDEEAYEEGKPREEKNDLTGAEFGEGPGICPGIGVCDGALSISSGVGGRGASEYEILSLDSDLLGATGEDPLKGISAKSPDVGVGGSSFSSSSNSSKILAVGDLPRIEGVLIPESFSGDSMSELLVAIE
jgi:hypothetical protein